MLLACRQCSEKGEFGAAQVRHAVWVQAPPFIMRREIPGVAAVVWENHMLMGFRSCPTAVPWAECWW